MPTPVPPRFPALATDHLLLREVALEDARNFRNLL